MRRHCNGEDPNLIRVLRADTKPTILELKVLMAHQFPTGVGPMAASGLFEHDETFPCACGLVFMDEQREVIWPHIWLDGREQVYPAEYQPAERTTLAPSETPRPATLREMIDDAGVDPNFLRSPSFFSNIQKLTESMKKTYPPVEDLGPMPEELDLGAASVPERPKTLGIPPASKGALQVLQFTPAGAHQRRANEVELQQLYDAANQVAGQHEVLLGPSIEQALAQFLVAIIEHAPPGPERSTAISRAREAAMWAQDAIRMEGH